MSGQSSDQSVASPMKRIRSELECPVCLNIPRELPIPSCPSGHFVCRPCKTRVTDCPTCRQPMPANMTNSPVGALIEQVQHKCKYNDQGCKAEMMLKDLMTHEKECPEKTIKCPYSGCDCEVKLNNFDAHALAKHSAIRRGSLEYTITHNDAIYDVRCSMKALDQLFHVNFGYHKPSNCFVFSIWLAKIQNVAAKYTVNFIIGGDNRRLCYDGIKVCSVEKVPTIDKCSEENGNLFLFLPMTMAINVSTVEGNREYLQVKFLFVNTQPHT